MKIDISEALKMNQPVKNKVVTCKSLFNKLSDYKNITFQDCYFEELFHLEIEKGDLTLVNCEFKEQTEDYKLILSSNISLKIENTIINGSFRIQGCNFVNIINSNFKNKLLFNSKGDQNIKIIHDAEKQGSSKISSLLFEGYYGPNSSLEIKEYSIEKIKFGTSIYKKTRIWGGNYGEINFSDARDLKNFQVFGNEETGAKVKVEKLIFHYLNLEGDILIKDASIDFLDMSPLNMNGGSLRFQNVTLNEEFIANQCNLEKVQFIAVNFYNAKLYLDWSLLTESFYSNIVWPKNYVVYPDLANSNYAWRVFKQIPKAIFGKRHLTDDEHVALKAQREVYRQLKVISQKNVNNIDAFIFYKNEMRVYWNDMRFKNEISWWDHILIFLDRYISNFGQSYIRPLIFLLVFHFFFFSCLLNWSYFYNHLSGEYEFGQFWILLNPVHKTPDYINSGFGHFTEFLMRVTGGYFIYHFIKATRKFGKV